MQTKKALQYGQSTLGLSSRQPCLYLELALATQLVLSYMKKAAFTFHFLESVEKHRVFLIQIQLSFLSPEAVLLRNFQETDRQKEKI